LRPCGSGKNALLRQRFPEDQSVTIDLLLPRTEARFARQPELLSGIAEQNPGKINIIDEVQKVPKFYFFDGGVARAVSQTIYSDVAPGTSYFDECFEHFVICEIYRITRYLNAGQRLFTLNSQDGFEIDLIIETPGKSLVVCEIKSATTVTQSHYKNLLLAKKDFPSNTRFVLLSNDKFSRREDEVEFFHWLDFLETEFLPQLA
jgi:predicted AAA+ superfamily ATPase